MSVFSSLSLRGSRQALPPAQSESAMSIWIPTKQTVQTYLEEWKHPAFAVSEDILNQLFQKDIPKNNHIDCVLIKVKILNELYSTMLYATRKMSEHIVTLAHENNLDARIADGDLSIVDEIAAFEFQTVAKDGNVLSGNKHFLSFASKYCSFHEPEKFPMYDSRIRKSLVLYLKNKGFKISESKIYGNYKAYCEAIEVFRDIYELRMFTWREIDKAMWMHGYLQSKK